MMNVKFGRWKMICQPAQDIALGQIRQDSRAHRSQRAGAGGKANRQEAASPSARPICSSPGMEKYRAAMRGERSAGRRRDGGAVRHVPAAGGGLAQGQNRRPRPPPARRPRRPQAAPAPRRPPLPLRSRTGPSPAMNGRACLSPSTGSGTKSRWKRSMADYADILMNPTVIRQTACASSRPSATRTGASWSKPNSKGRPSTRRCSRPPTKASRSSRSTRARTSPTCRTSIRSRASPRSSGARVPAVTCKQPWEVSQEIAASSPTEFNNAARNSITRGLNALNMVLDQATRNGHDPDWAQPEEVGSGGLLHRDAGRPGPRPGRASIWRRPRLLVRSGASAMPFAALAHRPGAQAQEAARRSPRLHRDGPARRCSPTKASCRSPSKALIARWPR